MCRLVNTSEPRFRAAIYNIPLLSIPFRWYPPIPDYALQRISNAPCPRTSHNNWVRDVEMGPIWNHEHAKVKAREYMDRHEDLEWTGHWRTTVPGTMSVIRVRPKSQ